MRIDGHSHANVAARVMEHRIRNSRPVGNPVEEVNSYVCGNWPWLCLDTNPKPPEIQPNASLALRASDWMSRFTTLRGKDDGSEQAVADSRSHICANCPQNQNYRGGCSSCVQSIDSKSSVYLRNRTASESSRLGACMVLSEHLPTSIWSTQLESLTEAQAALVPTNCWRRNT